MTIEYLMKPRQVRMHYRDLLMYPYTFRFPFTNAHERPNTYLAHPQVWE